MPKDLRQLLPYEELTNVIHNHHLGHAQIARRANIMARGKISSSRLYEIRQGDSQPYARELVGLAEGMGAKEFLPVMNNYFGHLYRIRTLTPMELNGSTDEEVFALMAELGKIADELQTDRKASFVNKRVDAMRVLLDRLQAEVSRKSCEK